ncbi:apiosidase-like domain-containing protein [Dyadobacter tibetensis]|uniref:apiosidase-like domain-containing protein n=1 Tax=Dyadobacter tibetensis TaxID=1211851 RepID=UPI000693AB6B|nr:DUF4038 domain-containing protein [Dyadobacter tibetensis]
MIRILTILILFQSCITLAQHPWPEPNRAQTMVVDQWTVHDVSYRVAEIMEDPFERQVFANMISQEDTLHIPLFFNGENEWVLRFSGNKPGDYYFELSGDIEELNGKKGHFSVGKNKKQNRHGGVVLNKKNPQHFYYQDGTPYRNLAFECDWLFALDYGQKNMEKSRQLLNTIAENGFNQIVMNVYSFDVPWPKDSLLLAHPEHEYGGRNDIYPFLGSNAHPDHDALNVNFFKHFDKVMAEMHDRELVSHLMIYVWNKMVVWPEMNSTADNRYFDYVIKRYQAFPNIIWDISKEALFYGRATNEYISERIERTRNLDAYDRLLSVHDYGFCRNHPEEVDFISTQDWKHTLYQSMLNVRQEFPSKPIFNIEHGGYEKAPYVVFPGAYDDAEVCLRRNYMCLFAGVYTTYY